MKNSEVYDVELTGSEINIILSTLQSECMQLRDNPYLNQHGLNRLLACDLIRLRLEGLGNGINHSLPAFIEDVKHYISNVTRGV
jgi:hypothetical protein